MKKAKLPLINYRLFINGKLLKSTYSYGKVNFKNLKQAEKFLKYSVRAEFWNIEYRDDNQTSLHSNMNAWSNTRHYNPNTKVWNDRMKKNQK